MKLAVISAGYPTDSHPHFTFVQQLVEQMIDQGVEISVIVPQSIVHNIVRHEPILPFENKYTTKKGNKYMVYRPKFVSFGDRGGLLGKIAKYTKTKATFRALNKVGYDAIYSHFWENCLEVYPYCLESNTPLFIACGEGDNALETMVDKMTSEAKADLKKSVAGVISVSSENKRKCIDYNLADEENIVVLPNCVDDTIFKPADGTEIRKQLGVSEDDFLTIFIGGFINRKGPNRVSDAIKKLNDPQIKSVFVGRFFDGEKVDPDCEGIVYKGSLHHDDLSKYLNAADLFVLPTLNEGCCNAIVESLACGVPVVSSDRSFNQDILNSNNSIQVNPEDVDAIAEAISKFKTDKALYSEKKSYVVEHANNYSISARARKIADFITIKINK